MKNILLIALLLLSFSSYSQERYIGLTRDSLIKFHAKYFDQVLSNDTALIVKIREHGSDWRYFKFDKEGKCEVCAVHVHYYNDFTDLEKKLKAKKFKDVGEVKYDYIVRSTGGRHYTKGNEHYLLMFEPINPNLMNTVRSVIYYKTK
jgi:hypothetical protein